MAEFNIGATSTYRVTKKELIDIINKTFTDELGSIAVITECETRDYNYNTEKIVTQSITFGKLLEI